MKDVLRRTFDHSGILAIQGFALFFCILTCLVCKLPLTDGSIYFLFQLFAVFIPGMAVSCLLKMDKKDELEWIMWSYVFGLLFLLIEYLLMAVLKISACSWLLNCLVSLLSLLYLSRLEKNENKVQQKDLFILLLFVAVIVSLCFFSISLANPIYEEKDVYLNKDFLFWVGNSLSFTKAFPVQDYRLPGLAFYYHYFSSVIIAQSSFSTGLSAVKLSFYFSYIIPCILLVFSAYYMLEKLLKKTLYIYIGIFLILMSEGSTSFLTNHLYFCPFGYDYACALSMISIGLLIKMYKEDDFGLRNMLVSCMLIAMDTGFKATTAIVTLMGFGITAFDMLVKRRWKKGVICGISWLLSFLAIYCIFIADLSGTTEQTNDLMFLGIIGAFENNYLAMDILDDLQIIHGFPNNGFTLIVTLLLYILRSNRPAMYLFALSLIYQIIVLFKKKEISLILLALNMICIWGTLLTNVTYQDGNSQIYFIMSIFPFGVASGLHVLERFEDKSKYLKTAVLLFLVLISYDDVRRFVFDRVKPEVVHAIHAFSGSEIDKSNRVLYAKKDRELTKWLKTNTEDTGLLAVDTFESEGFKKDEVLGVFGERYIWNDGQYGVESEKTRRRGIVEKFFENDPAAKQALIDENVRYVIRTLSKDSSFNDRAFEIVFQSSDYIVYKLF